MLAACFALLGAAPASAQLRIVTYNPTNGPRSGMDIVLKSIGEETRNGIAKPIDVLLLQEQSRSAGLPDTQAFVNLLNNTVYAGTGITYARGNLIGGGDDTQTIVYRTDTVQLLSEAAVGTVSFSGQPRQALRYKLKPVGYDDSAALYIYNSHYKASQGTDATGVESNANRRLAEATAIRANADALGEGAHAIFVGDHNFYDFDAQEPAFGKLISAGPGQVQDPINRIGTWHNNASFADVHTQSPTTTAHYGGQITGGLDDRFDFQLVTGELMDGEGISYLSGSYHAFGNNGSTYNTDLNAAGNTNTFSGVTSYTRSQILNALVSVTDHLPVVADYQIPSFLGVQVAATPATVALGALASINVSIQNLAPAIAVLGADELDYTLSVTGDLSGGGSGSDLALGGGDDFEILLNTMTPGLKSGLITVASNSQAAANALFTLPVSFQVTASLLASDFNEDGSVDGLDLGVWKQNFGLASGGAKTQGDADLDADVDGADYLAWQRQFGGVPASGVNQLVVPEPNSAALLLVGCIAGLLRSAQRASSRRRRSSGEFSPR